jgi:hypothetical protein
MALPFASTSRSTNWNKCGQDGFEELHVFYRFHSITGITVYSRGAASNVSQLAEAATPPNFERKPFVPTLPALPIARLTPLSGPGHTYPNRQALRIWRFNPFNPFRVAGYN